jgi:hypothetical protein
MMLADLHALANLLAQLEELLDKFTDTEILGLQPG